MSCLPGYLEEEFNKLWEASKNPPLKGNRFCEHDYWSTGGGFHGVCLYGKKYVVGAHVLHKCDRCGRSHYKIAKHWKYRVLDGNRKEQHWVQLEFP